MENNNNSLLSKLKENSIAVFFGLAGIALIAGAVIFSLNKNKTPQDRYKAVTEKKYENCEVKNESYVVDGGTDIFAPGSEIEVELNYYACNKGQRDEIVMVKTPGREQPIIKYIKIMPGDRYKVVQGKDSKYRIDVNGDKMENSKGEEYALSERKMRMIKLYESNFKDGVKEDVYFVFGESVSGGFDSTRFGPVMPERMLGRVVTKPENAKKSNSKDIAKTSDITTAEKSEVIKEEVQKANPAAKAPTKPAPSKVVPKATKAKPASKKQ